MRRLIGRLRDRQEWRFLGVLPRADAGLAAGWWGVLALRGALPAAFAVAMGVVTGAVERGSSLTVPLAFMGVVFVSWQVATPIHAAISANLGDRTAAWLYDQLTDACVAPPGMAHLEDPELANDLQVARDFDLGMTGPPLSVSMDFIAQGLVQMTAGLVSAALLFAFAWWAPFVLAGAWLSTHWLLRESGVWKDRNNDEVRAAQRDADYAYRLAVDPPAAKELRLFGLADWTIDRFVARRRRLHELQYEATRMRERSLVSSLVVVLLANAVVFWSLAEATIAGDLPLGRLVTFAQAAIGAALIAFGGLNWALDGAAAPVAAVLRLKPRMAPAGALESGDRPAVGLPATELRFRDVTFAYPSGDGLPVLDGFDLTVPAGSSIAIVGQNGAGKTTLAKLLCRLYDPQQGAVEVDGVDVADLDLDGWRRRVTAVFQDYIKFELPLRDNVVPTGEAAGVSDEVVQAALDEAGAGGLADLDTVLAKGYPGGTDLSDGWRWPGPSPRSGWAPAWCCSTSPPPSSTCGARPRSSTASSPPRRTAPRSSSRTGSRRCVTPTASACSSTVGWSSSAPTTSSWPSRGGTARCSTSRPSASPRASPPTATPRPTPRRWRSMRDLAAGGGHRRVVAGTRVDEEVAPDA